MKRILLLLLLLTSMQTAKAQKMVVLTTDNQVSKFDVSKVKDIDDTHEWVDLGLPSGTLWATCNIGADSPEEYGDYFAWGETQPKSNYSWATYKYCKGSSNTLTRYCYQSDYGYNGFTDTLTELLPEDDAATANWGENWHTPSLAQIQELFDSTYTTTAYTTQNGVKGRKITSNINGESIFLPAAGYRYGDHFRHGKNPRHTDLYDNYGDYWTRSFAMTEPIRAQFMRFTPSKVMWGPEYRYPGHTIRPVRKPHQSLSFLEGNPIWVYKYERLTRGTAWKDGVHYGIFVDTGYRDYRYYFLGGQEEIDGKVYTMMGEVKSDGEGELAVSRWLPVREENGIVYAFTDSLPGLVEHDYLEPPYLQQGNECVLYNFNTEIGESLYPQNEYTKVESYGTYQLMNGAVCRVLKTTIEDFDLYEKLGYLHDGLYYGVMDPPSELISSTGGDVYATHLNAYYQNDIMLYKAPDIQESICVNDTCWSRDDGNAYVRSYKVDPRQEEVFAYIRQLQKEKEPVSFTAGQIATIILPTNPDASKGKYYRLDRYEDGQIIFEQELQPQAHIPYIIVPNEDFSINLRTLDLAGCYRDTISVAGISFIGSYVSETFDYPDGFYIDFIDITPDCRFDESCVIGALRAYLLVRWDDPYNQGGTRVPPLNKREIVLRDDETGIKSLNATVNHNDKIFNLAGQRLSKPQKGIYIENGKKIAAK